MESLIPQQKEKDPETLPKRNWNTSPILSSAEFITFATIREDDVIVTSNIDDPKFKVWVVLNITAALNKHSALIITDGDTWHPVTRYTHHHISTRQDAKRTEIGVIVKNFTHQFDLVFNFMNNEDRKLIAKVVSDALNKEEKV